MCHFRSMAHHEIGKIKSSSKIPKTPNTEPAMKCRLLAIPESTHTCPYLRALLVHSEMSHIYLYWLYLYLIYFSKKDYVAYILSKRNSKTMYSFTIFK